METIMPLAKEEVYLQFLELLLKGYSLEAESFLATGFKAKIKDSQPELTFAELRQEIERQRNAFPDIGENIRVIDITKLDLRLLVTYTMVTEHAGEILSQDLVDFNEEGQLTRLEMVTDMHHTMAQMFPS
jgi:hypothetical protein